MIELSMKLIRAIPRKYTDYRRGVVIALFASAN
jgi:hypothetical protein